METVLTIIAGLTAFLSALYKVIQILVQHTKVYRAILYSVQNHRILTSIREWRNAIIKLHHPSPKKEMALKKLMGIMVDTIENQVRDVIMATVADRKYKIDLISWHMNTCDAIYNRALSEGLPPAFIEKFREWVSEDEAILLDAVKQQTESFHMGFVHVLDDVLKDYILSFNMIFSNMYKLKTDFVGALNGELDKILVDY